MTGQPDELDHLAEPDHPAAYALANHIADHPISTIQAAFRYLGWSLTITAVPEEET
ncbi:hypothetical protein [Streptomyces rubiginosohelvolus]|uniref:hypothetical protein n=1 Tax=Streptomyces rubiginosohelvolus TaxID=67362 RepID=UPI003648A182